jgi:hypothetical protein
MPYGALLTRIRRPLYCNAHWCAVCAPLASAHGSSTWPHGPQSEAARSSILIAAAWSQAKVSEVQPEGSAGGSVLLSTGEVVEYDWLVVALGAEVDARGVPGVREHAVPFSSYEDALKVG